MALLFTNINHIFRMKHGLSANEYILADMIYHLCKSDKSKVKDWCYMSRPHMADELGVSKQTIINLISSLVDKGIVHKDEQTSFLKTTVIWEDSFSYESVQKDRFTTGKDSLPPSKESLPDGGKESLPYINNIDINSDKRKEIDKESISGTLFPFPPEDVPPIINKKTQAQLKKEEMDETFKKFIIFFNYVRKKYLPNAKGVSGITKARREFEKRLKDYSKEDISNAVENAFKSDFHKKSNYQHVTPEFILREEKLEKYATIAKVEESTGDGLVH